MGEQRKCYRLCFCERVEWDEVAKTGMPINAMTEVPIGYVGGEFFYDFQVFGGETLRATLAISHESGVGEGERISRGDVQVRATASHLIDAVTPRGMSPIRLGNLIIRLLVNGEEIGRTILRVIP